MSQLDTTVAVKQMMEDGVDVLVDLNGHTLRSGIGLFAHRPAAVQVSFLGYSLTSGLPDMDYFIADPITSPTWMSRYFTEALVRWAVKAMWHSLSFTPLSHAPLPPLPQHTTSS